jgi:DNA-binding beta-propeller fold protein YncE
VKRAGGIRVVALYTLALAASCAHEPPRTPVREEPVVWPAAPDRPRVRLAGVLPRAGAQERGAWSWRRFFDAVLGIDRATSETALLARPFGVAAGPDREIYVADPDGPLVARVDSEPAAPIECRDRPWVAPMAVAIGRAGAVYVADAGAHAIVEVAADGRCRAIGEEQLVRPTGIALSGDRLYVVDPPSHRVVVLSIAGELVARIGERGDEAGQLNYPTAVSLAPDGSLLVVDALNFRVARFSADGAWLGAFGAPGDGGGAFTRPKCVTADAGGRIYVTDAQRDVVLVFRADGTFEYAIGAPGGEPGRFTGPAGVVVAGDRLHVADSYNRRVQVFEILGGTT